MIVYHHRCSYIYMVYTFIYDSVLFVYPIAVYAKNATYNYDQLWGYS